MVEPAGWHRGYARAALRDAVAFTSIDYDKFRQLRITHVATRFEELIGVEANDELTPEQILLTAVDDALEARRQNKIARLIRQALFPIPHASIAEIDYRGGRGPSPVECDVMRQDGSMKAGHVPRQPESRLVRSKT